MSWDDAAGVEIAVTVGDGLERDPPSRAVRALRNLGEARVPAGPEAPSVARTAVGRWLEGHVPGHVLEDARLLVSELVTNSLLHADSPTGAPVRVSAAIADGVVRLEVTDAGRAGEVVRRVPDRDQGGGFGLHLVEMLAARWGVRHEGGTQVWFELLSQLTDDAGAVRA